jgi:hypothetical protein
MKPPNSLLLKAPVVGDDRQQPGSIVATWSAVILEGTIGQPLGHADGRPEGGSRIARGGRVQDLDRKAHLGRVFDDAARSANHDRAGQAGLF